MKAKKVMIWVGSDFREVTVMGPGDIDQVLMDMIRDGVMRTNGETVPVDDRQWGGYRRIEIHISPAIVEELEHGVDEGASSLSSAFPDLGYKPFKITTDT